MSARKLNRSRLWLVAGAGAALAAVATPVAALEPITRPETAAIVMPVASAPSAAFMAADAAPGTSSLRLAEHTPTMWGESQDQSDFTVTRNGISHRYTVHDGETFRVLDDGTHRPLTAAERREVTRHRRAEAQAARHIRTQEAHIRRQEAHVREQEAHVRTQLTLAADQFSNGAQQLREEADRRRDPAHRAREIEKTRLQGETVTDQQLIDSIPRLRQSAEEMEREAARILASAPR